VQAQTDSAGHYDVQNLAPGDYDISVSAQGFSTNSSKVTVASGAKQNFNLTLGGVLSLEDLGISQTAKYAQVPFQQVSQGNETRITGTIPSTLTDFKIDPPSLLALPVKNEIPVRVEMTWRKEK
jgi:hypothetical protein